jgi:hypothetical protein
LSSSSSALDDDVELLLLCRVVEKPGLFVLLFEIIAIFCVVNAPPHLIRFVTATKKRKYVDDVDRRRGRRRNIIVMPEVETCDMGDIGILKAGGNHGLWYYFQPCFNLLCMDAGCVSNQVSLAA